MNRISVEVQPLHSLAIKRHNNWLKINPLSCYIYFSSPNALAFTIVDIYSDKYLSQKSFNWLTIEQLTWRYVSFTCTLSIKYTNVCEPCYSVPVGNFGLLFSKFHYIHVRLCGKPTSHSQSFMKNCPNNMIL